MVHPHCRKCSESNRTLLYQGVIPEYTTLANKKHPDYSETMRWLTPLLFKLLFLVYMIVPYTFYLLNHLLFFW